MEKIGIGRTAEVFKDNDGTAVKLFYDWMPKTEAAHEASILQTILQVCPLAPKFYGLAQADGRSGLRFEYIDGKMAARLFFERPLDFFKTARSIGRLHRELHSLKVPGLRAAEDVYGPALREYEGMDGAARDMLLDFLHGDRKDALCHGDFHPENVLIDASGNMRVIDWVNAYKGDPLSDVARSYYLMRYGRSPDKLTVFKRLLESIAKPMLANAYLRSYFEKSEFPKVEFRRWLLIIMINRWAKERIPEEEKTLKAGLEKLPRSVLRA